jgi:hypothetical protein
MFYFGGYSVLEERIIMSNTPRTDAFSLSLYQKLPNGSINIKGLEIAGELADFARELESENSLMRNALQAIEERFVDGENTHDDWQFMGETAKKTLDKLPNPDKV